MATTSTPEPQSPAEELSVWTVEGRPIIIEYLNSALEFIRLEAVKGITLLRHGGIEVGGVLFGSRDCDRVRILTSRALRSEYAYGPGLVLSQNDEEALKRLLEEAAADQKLSGMEPVGWYQSHTRSGICLGEAAASIYNRFFPEPWQVALILHPAQLGPTEAGFFFREGDGTLRSDSSYHSFTIYPTYIAVKPLDPDLNAVAPLPEPESLVKRTEPWRELPPPRRFGYTPEKKTSLNWAWLIAAFALAVLGLGIMSGVLHISGLPAGHATLNLRASDRDGQVHVEWDRAAEPIQAAQKASLLIQDGDQKLETPLSEELLQHGTLVYRRKTGDVEVRLRVYGDDAEPVQESTRLLGLPAVPAERLDVADRPPVAAPVPVRGTKRATVRDPRPGESQIQLTEPEKAPAAPAQSQAPPPPQPELSARVAPNPTPAPENAKLELPVAKPIEEHTYHGPSRGRLIWTGHLPANGRLEITGEHASSGDLTGRLPDVPVKIGAYPATHSRGAIVAYAADLPSGKDIREMPGRTNGWTEMIYKRSAKRAGEISITQTPSARNHWRSIGLRADRKVSVVVIDWEVLGHKR